MSNAEHERVKNIKRERKQRRQARIDRDPLAFGWEKETIERDGEETDVYRCECCSKEHGTLPACLRHISRQTDRSEGQTGLDDWA